MNVSGFYVKNYLSNQRSDSEAIESAIQDALNFEGVRRIVFSGKDYYIDRAILIPSNTHIIIDGCTIKQNRRVYDNIFRGDNLLIDGADPYGVPLDVFSLENIKITGINGARLIGTDEPQVGYHKVIKEFQPMVGDFWGYRSHMISISNCKNFEISGLSLSQTMNWAVSFDHCSNGYIHDIDVRSNVKNGDGIDFRSGCHHCKVENITGFTSDDTIACTALSRGKKYASYPEKNYLMPLEPFNVCREDIDGDVHDIEICNINTGGHHHGVICLAAWGNKVYNIHISNVCETDEGGRESTVKIYTGYGDEYRDNDIHDITLENIHAKTATYAVQVMCEVGNLKIHKIAQDNPVGELLFTSIDK